MSDPIKEVKVIAPLPNPHLSLWESSLKIKIANNKCILQSLEKELALIKLRKKTHEIDLEKVKNTMSKSLEKVKMAINSYHKNMTKMIDDTMNNNNNSEFCTKQKGIELFSLYKKMYQNACTFFSRKECSHQKSSLNTEPKTFGEYIWDIFSEFTDDTSTKDSWTDLLIPIWSIEEYTTTLNNKISNLSGELKKINEKYNIILSKFKNIKTDNESFYKELNAVKQFSQKIIKCRKIKFDK